MVVSRKAGKRNFARRGQKRKAHPARARRLPPGRPTPAPDEESAEFPIVGVGASAGGLEALTRLLEHLPSNTGMAFVLVQHLDPRHDSKLTEILGRSTRMPVTEVSPGLRILPDHVYVTPANAELGVADGVFRLDPRRRDRGRDLAIDHFFQSLAETHKSRAIGVILSGSLSDGALGLRAIKAEGGVTFAQDEESARFPDMPRAALAAGAVDFVDPPDRIAQALARIGAQALARVGVQARLRRPRSESDEAAAAGKAEIARILAMLRRSSGVDFSSYRQTTVTRRIVRRMALRKAENLKKYVAMLREEPQELQSLYEDILITVTAFFRNPDVFQSLKTVVFPSLLKDRPADLPVRIWVPGCSTGEEVYSIAITLFESLEVMDVPPPIQIFATDISETAIEKARSGSYLENSMVNVSPERRRRFFSKTGYSWQISRSIRETCVFARQNLTADPPFSNLDLISCRNLLIYLEPVLQKRVLPLFFYALRPAGYLMLGNAESISGFGELFAAVDRRQRIFQKRPGADRPPLSFQRAAAPPARTEAAPEAAAEPTAVQLQKEADRLVLGRFGPSGVLVDEDYQIVQFRGHTSRYLEAAPGAASFSVLKMAREGLMVELRAALLKAKRTGKPVRTDSVRVRYDGLSRPVHLEILPLREDASHRRHYLVLFEEAEEKTKPGRADRPLSAHAHERRLSHERTVKLEQELTATKDYLQSIIEGQEASNEELKSANEEILSSNEELQSTNEELETAKEELQSTNEELSTLNEELQNRNTELNQLNNDLNNLLRSTNLAVVILDRQGRLRRFTPQAEKLLNLIPSDLGRRMRDIQPNFRIPDFEKLVTHVIERVQDREREVQDREGRWYLMHARPYQTLDNRIDGAVIVFFDIDPMKRSLEEVNKARDYAESLVETVREALVVLDESFCVRTANQSFYRIFRLAPLRTQGKPLQELWSLDDSGSELKARLELMAREEAPLQDLELRLDVEGERRTLLLNATRVLLPGETQRLVFLAIEDITERKRSEAALRASEAQYRLIFETAREGIWLMDAESGKLLDVNPFLQDLLGYSREELVGKRPWEVGLYADAEGARARFESRLAGGFGFEQEVCLRTKTGQAVYVEAITNTYRLGDRLVTQANLRDVTERTKLQDQVRQMQKLDSIGRLAGGVAHDFNNLLNIISAHVALLTREGLPADKRAESANSVEKAVERGSAVVKQLLTFARKTEVAFEPTDVNVVVEELTSMLRETFPKSIKVQKKLSEDLPRIHADPNQLHQALLNLAVNARDAMPQGGVLTVGSDAVSGPTLRAKFPEASAETYVELCVADTGHGMDATTRRRIFEPFFTTKGAKGQGLGLAVVYGIVNAHHGWIDLETEAGKGTTFRLYFAVSAVAVEGSVPPEARRKETRQLTSSRKTEARGRVVLFVEDEEMLLRPVRSLLEENGYEVLTAADGVEAVKCFAQNADRISAVLLDLGLPRLGGWQAFLKMRELDPTVRCIVASGNLDADQRDEMMKAGVLASVRKPYTGDQILKAVRTVIH